MEERLQKILSASGVASRREAERLIQEGKVTVNGIVAQLGTKADLMSDKIEVSGAPLGARSDRVYIMLHKPRGYITTMKDERGRKTVAELVSGCKVRVYPVGRLDANSEGLLIMTNDGEVANKLMHPSHEVMKLYETKVSGRDIDRAVATMREDMIIDGVKAEAASVHIEEVIGQNATLLIGIHEGRNRQVRKMCEQTGLDVRRLRRLSEGKLTLGNLPYGKWRALSEEEINYLRSI
jgi:23S rRNA pseudouridine2605 synthase